MDFPLGDIPIPAPPWLFLTVLLAIFFLHATAMWMTVGGLIIGVTQLIRERVYWQKEKVLRYMPILMAIAINLGVPPLLMLQVLYAPFFFTSSVLIAGPWLGVFFLLNLTYGMVYAARYGAKERWQAITFLIVSTISALLISFFFTNNISLMISPQLWEAMYSSTRNGFQLNPELFSVTMRWIWVLSPAFIAGSFLLKDSKLWGVLSGLMALVGLYFYRQTISAEILSYPLVDLTTWLSNIFAVMVIAFAIMPLPKLEEHIQRLIQLFLTLGMGGSIVALRHGIRCAALDPIYPLSRLEELNMQPQPVLIAIFVIAILVGLGVVFWMYIRGGKELAI
ncbi:MAG: hypothetical protein SFT81_01240 [Candidatus Caenarcaniphilales bacterium]|nr:hypothetical protein [Candidatus Caenarcaniphilales bacterium]